MAKSGSGCGLVVLAVEAVAVDIHVPTIPTIFSSFTAILHWNATIGSEVRIASIAANHPDLLVVQPGAHGLGGIAPFGNITASLFTALTYKNQT